jgi:hypothetical protein
MSTFVSRMAVLQKYVINSSTSAVGLDEVINKNVLQKGVTNNEEIITVLLRSITCANTTAGRRKRDRLVKVVSKMDSLAIKKQILTNVFGYLQIIMKTIKTNYCENAASFEVKGVFETSVRYPSICEHILTMLKKLQRIISHKSRHATQPIISRLTKDGIVMLCLMKRTYLPDPLNPSIKGLFMILAICTNLHTYLNAIVD